MLGGNGDGDGIDLIDDLVGIGEGPGVVFVGDGVGLGFFGIDDADEIDLIHLTINSAMQSAHAAGADDGGA